MGHAIHFLISHPVALLAVAIVLEQVGIPISSAPILILIGALTAPENAYTPLAFCVAIAACVLVDCGWFELGRMRKLNLGWLSKSLKSADLGSARHAHRFAVHKRHLALFVARFLPGPNLVASFAGFMNVSRVRFVMADTIASALWTSTYLAAGHLLPLQIRSHLHSALSTSPGWGILFMLGIAAAVFGASRLRHYRIRRRTPQVAELPVIASEPLVSNTYLETEVDC